MRDVTVVDNKGKKIEKHSTYSELIATFISNPADISNNKGLKRMEQSLELTINKIVFPTPASPNNDLESPQRNNVAAAN